MINGAGAISNDVLRKLPRDATTRCYDKEKPSGRKIGGLFCVQLQYDSSTIIWHKIRSVTWGIGTLQRGLL